MELRHSLFLAILAIVALTVPLPAASPDRWVPIRWHGGALDRDPAGALQLLERTPINCLLIPWSSAAEDQRRAAALAKQARARGWAALALVSPGPQRDSPAGVGQADLDGFLEPGVGRSSIVTLVEGIAPRVRAMAEDAATATPTSEPWIDSNTWRVRALRACDKRPVWLDFGLEAASTEDYLRAIADAAAGGGRWVFSPDPALLMGVLHEKPQALTAWDRIASWLRFFEQHAEWREYAPSGPLGIVYEAAAKDADIGNEVLNLVARRRIPYRVIDRTSLSSQALAGLRAVLAASLSNPTASERELLKNFVMEGGLLVAGPAWASSPAEGGDYVSQEIGTGRLVTFRSDPPDPDDLARRLPSLIGRNNLGIRLFNGPSVLCFLSSDPSGAKTLVQLINYASAPSQDVTVRIGGDWRSARLYSPDGAPEAIPLGNSAGSVQVKLPRLAVYAALLFEKQ